MKTARTYSIREELQDIYSTSEIRTEVEPRMKKQRSWMMHSRLQETKMFCGTKNHWNEYLNYFDKKYTNDALESIDISFKT